jgi:holo-[acyl-carrier protein] synthase
MLALGIDLVAVSRIAALIEHHGDRFLERCFRPDERVVASRIGRAGAQAIAARWAAKEACVKAFGASGKNVPYRDIEVVRSAGGEPSLKFYGLALELHTELGSPRTLLSLSHERDSAVAVVAFSQK